VDDMEGFFAPDRVDATVERMHAHPQTDSPATPPLPPFPTGVTRANWPELRDAEWQWAANLPWPLDREEYLYHGRAILAGIKGRHGEANVLLGPPGERRGPIAGQWIGQWQVGVYVLENLQLPESVRKFMAEHEEKPL